MIGTLFWNADGDITDANDTFLQMVGYTKHEILSGEVSWRDMTPPEYMEQDDRALQEITATSVMTPIEKEYIRKDGSRIPILLGAASLPESTLNGVAFVLDITARKRAEEALRESEARYRALFNNMGNGVAIYQSVDNGEDFIFVDFNKTGEKIDHVQKSELIGKSVLERFPGVKDFGLFDVFQRVWKTGRPEHHPISVYKDKRIIGWRDNFVYKLPTGEIVAIYSDETERKQAEEALRQSEEKYREFVEGTDDFITQVDSEGRFIYLNAKALKVFGLSKEKCIGSYAFDFIHPDDRERTKIAFGDWVRNRVSRATFENRQVNQTTGEVYHMYWTINFHYGEDGNITGINSIARDITEQRQRKE